MKKIFLNLLCLNLIFSQSLKQPYIMAEELYQERVYNVYDQNENLLLQTQNVIIGDIFINKSFERYEVIFVDEENCFAVCEYLDSIKKPKITKKQISKVNSTNYKKYIGMYCTHNDESYQTGDNTTSVYGKGGIHDIALLLCQNLQKEGINVIFDETLHIPHDTNAYKRSNVTAKSLLNDYSLDAIFDIHRDGASRSLYINKTNNQERCMVRIVVGQANPNKEKNLEFALYLMSVSEIVCPWLFLDIYYAKGDYNQNLTNKSLLFEMGSHLVEKELVKKTVPYLAEVISTALYNTQINSEGELTIGKNEESKDETLNDYFEDGNVLDTNMNSSNTVNDNQQNGENLQRTETVGKIIIVLIFSAILAFITPIFIFKWYHRNKNKK